MLLLLLDLPIMINKQAITAAKALVLSFRACRSFMNMQFSPQKFSGQTHRYLKRGSWFMHVPPFKHGMSRHSLRSTHPLPSDETTIPSPQLCLQVNVKEKQLLKCKLDELWPKARCSASCYVRFTCTRTCSINLHIRMARGRMHLNKDYWMRNIFLCS